MTNPRNMREEAKRAVTLLEAVNRSILKMAKGAVADGDTGMYLRAYSADIGTVIELLKEMSAYAEMQSRAAKPGGKDVQHDQRGDAEPGRA